MRHVSVLIATLTCSPAGVFLGTLPSEASDLIITPEIASGVTYLQYKQRAGFFPESAQTFGEYEVSAALPFIKGGLRAYYRPFYLSIEGNHTFKGEDSDNLIITSPPFAQNVALQSEFQRSDLSVYAGYQINRQFRLYAGYKYAKADIRNDVSSDGDIAGFLSIPVSGKLDINVTYQGPIAGFAYVLELDELKGRLTFSSGLNYYFADVTQDFQPAADSSLPRMKGGAHGRSVGYYLGIGWRGQMFPNLYYSFVGDTSRSDFNMDSNVSDFSETEYRFRLGLEYQLDRIIGG